MRKVALAGVAILALSMIVSGAGYLGGGGFQWTPSDMGFIYSSMLTLGFIASIAAGLFGATKENEEFLIAGGVACIALALANKLFINRLYSWGYLDAMWLVAGILMILDRFHVKRVRETEEAEGKPNHEQLLDKFDKLITQTGTAEPQEAMGLEREMYDVKRMLWLEAMNKPELAKTLRGRLYLSKVGQEIVKRFIDADLKVIEPDIQMAQTPKYPKLADLERFSQTKVQATLNELVEGGILQRELYEKLIACPHCHQTSKVFIRNKCSKCGSLNIRMNRLLEHTRCGAIYKEQEYQGAKCPKCENSIEDKAELKSVGIAFECDSCKSVFGDPNQSFYCRNCASDFDLKSSELTDTYSYKFNDEMKPEAREVLTVTTTADTMEGVGFEVNVSGSLKGKTGVDHQFTIAASKGEKLYATDLLVAKPDAKVDMTMVLPSYAKFMDIPDARPLVVAVPGLESQARDFLSANHILFVEGENLSEIGERVKQILK